MLCKFILTDFSAFYGKQPFLYERSESDVKILPFYVWHYNSPAYSSQSAGVFFEMIQITFKSVFLINGQTFSARMFNK